MQLLGAELQALDHRGQGHGVGAAGDLHQEGGDDGQGERELDDELGADARHRLHLHQPVEPLDGLEDDVEPDPAPGDLRDGLPGGEPLRADELPIRSAHALKAGTLSTEHRDPFDRILAAQAILEAARLVTNDHAFSGFPDLDIIW